MKYHSELLGATVYPEEQIIFFYGGIFSQWAECCFTYHPLGVKVNCAEQAMMLAKAKFFNDIDAYEAILKADHPRKQKAIGRQVKNYDENKWSEVRYDIVKYVNYDKFSQNKAWKELLILTRPYLLVEASPTDRIWGIGMGVDNPNLFNYNLWGLNLLGKALTNVRNEMLMAP